MGGEFSGSNGKSWLLCGDCCDSAVDSNAAGRFCICCAEQLRLGDRATGRELPNNIVYAGAIDALIEALEEDEDMGVREDAKSSLLRVGDPRGLQIIEDLEMEGLL